MCMWHQGNLLSGKGNSSEEKHRYFVAKVHHWVTNFTYHQAFKQLSQKRSYVTSCLMPTENTEHHTPNLIVEFLFNMLRNPYLEFRIFTYHQAYKPSFLTFCLMSIECTVWKWIMLSTNTKLGCISSISLPRSPHPEITWAPKLSSGSIRNNCFGTTDYWMCMKHLGNSVL